MPKLEFDEEQSRLTGVVNSLPQVVDLRRRCRRLLGPAAGDRVLDVGSGTGVLAGEIAKLVGSQGSVTGIDVSDEMVAIARNECVDFANVEFQVGDAHALPFPDDRFDRVVSIQVFEYFEDVPAAVREVFRVLKPGGRAVIVDSDSDANFFFSRDPERMRRLMDLWAGHAPHRHLPRTLGYEMRRAGFRLDDCVGITFVDTEFNDTRHSYYLKEWMVPYALSQGVDSEEVDAWASELQSLSDEGAYFYSWGTFAFVGLKPLVGTAAI